MDTTKEIEDQKSRERASAYQQMAQLWAWTDFLKFVSGLKETAIKELTQTNDFNATEAKFGEIKGILKTVEKIERELDYILNWKEEV